MALAHLGLRFAVYFANIPVPITGGISEGLFKLHEESDNNELERAFRARQAIRNALLLEHGKTDWAKTIQYGHVSELYVPDEAGAKMLEERAIAKIGDCELGFQPLRCMHGLIGFYRTLNFSKFGANQKGDLAELIVGLGMQPSENFIKYVAYSGSNPWADLASQAVRDGLHRQGVENAIYQRMPGDLKL